MTHLPKIVAIPAVLIVLAACGTKPVDRVASGAGIGAGVGAVTGVIVGSPAAGAAVGAAVGGAAGGLSPEKDIDLGKPIWR